VLELGRGEGREARLARRFRLAPQDRARRHRHVIVRLFALDVARDEGRLLQPARHAQGRHVGHHVEVAVAELPVGEGVTRHRLHLHVDGEEVIAGMAARLGDLLHEHLGVEALAHQPAVVVGEARDHGFDLARSHHCTQCFGGEHASRLVHRSS